MITSDSNNILTLDKIVDNALKFQNIWKDKEGSKKTRIGTIYKWIFEYFWN